MDHKTLKPIVVPPGSPERHEKWLRIYKRGQVLGDARWAQFARDCGMEGDSAAEALTGVFSFVH
jgi:hypothetical protein